MTISQKMTNKRRENISIAMKGKHNSPKTEFKKGHHPVAGFQKGHKLTPEQMKRRNESAVETHKRKKWVSKKDIFHGIKEKNVSIQRDQITGIGKVDITDHISILIVRNIEIGEIKFSEEIVILVRNVESREIKFI